MCRRSNSSRFKCQVTSHRIYLKIKQVKLVTEHLRKKSFLTFLPDLNVSPTGIKREGRIRQKGTDRIVFCSLCQVLPLYTNKPTPPFLSATFRPESCLTLFNEVVRLIFLPVIGLDQLVDVLLHICDSITRDGETFQSGPVLDEFQPVFQFL